MVEEGAGGEGEQPGCDAAAEVVCAAGSVTFEAEQVFAGDDDGLDQLPGRGTTPLSGSFVRAGLTIVAPSSLTAWAHSLPA